MNSMNRTIRENYQIPRVENLTKSDGKFVIQFSSTNIPVDDKKELLTEGV
jgi:hypothetical protein